MKEQKSDEIDLTNLFSVFKEKIKASIVLLFDLIDYLLKKWILITALIVLGLIIGYVTQNNYNHNKDSKIRKPSGKYLDEDYKSSSSSLRHSIFCCIYNSPFYSIT